MSIQLNRSDVDRIYKLYVDRTRVAIGLPPQSSNVPRGTIQGFSERAADRLRQYLLNSMALYEFFGTLTVADDILSPPLFKAAQNRFFTWFMRKQQGQARVDATRVDGDIASHLSNVSLCWFLEFQKRGAPHLHFFYTHFIPWRESASTWCDAIDQPWAFETSTKFEKLYSAGNDAARAAYASKTAAYASKLTQKTDPQGREWGRWWGVRGLRETVSATSALEVKRHNLDALISVTGLLNQRAMKAAEAGEVAIVPWKNGLGTSIFFRASCSHETKALIYGAMGALLTHASPASRPMGDRDEDDPSWERVA